jgi:tellurite resistance protein TerC
LGQYVIHKTVHLTYKAARRIAVAVVGGTVVLLGIIMIVTPGPALVVIPIGLAILSAEFAWARHWLRRLRESISNGLANDRASRADSHRDRVNS